MITSFLIHSLISSRLDFCNSLLAGLHSATFNRLQTVQMTAARLLTGLRKHDNIFPVLTELHWLLSRAELNSRSCCSHLRQLMVRPQDMCHLRPGLRSSGLTLQMPITHLKGYGDRAFFLLLLACAIPSHHLFAKLTTCTTSKHHSKLTSSFRHLNTNFIG